jgi:hypothetical protein
MIRVASVAADTATASSATPSSRRAGERPATQRTAQHAGHERRRARPSGHDRRLVADGLAGRDGRQEQPRGPGHLPVQREDRPDQDRRARPPHRRHDRAPASLRGRQRGSQRSRTGRSKRTSSGAHIETPAPSTKAALSSDRLEIVLAFTIEQERRSATASLLLI